MTRAATVCRPDPVPSHDDLATPPEAGPGAGRPARPGRIRSARDFDALRRTSRRARRGPVRVAFVGSPAGSDGVRVAYAIGRAVGGAVVRNRLRRRLRVVLAEACGRQALVPGDYLVSVGPEAADLPFSELRALVTTALEALR